jgi:hypothetical protein
MARTQITAEIDDIANSVQYLGKKYPRSASTLKKIAARLDLVSNELETQSSKTASRRRAAPSDRSERLPGEWGPEDEYQDSYEADDYHRVPVGKDSLSKAIDKNIPDILSDLDFAQTTNGRDNHRIHIQSSRRASAWPFADLTPAQFAGFVKAGQWDMVDRAANLALANKRTASPIEYSEDRTGSEDNLSTADLGESGDEDDVPPIDKDEQGGTLQFYGTYPAGDGPDSGHHRRSVEPPNRERRMAQKRQARDVLKRIADREIPVQVEDPDRLLNSDPGDDVERDHPMGGLSGRYKGSEPTPRRQSSRQSGRQASVKVYRPTHVPKELHHFWHGAAQYLAGKGRLLRASGDVNYREVNKQYVRLLSHVTRIASSQGT